MPALLISDLHLSDDRPEITQAFFHFLQTTASQADSLYILGDLFESWIGDDDPNATVRAVIQQLRQLSDSGVKLYFQHGNRDFMIGKRFARETGCTLLPDVYVAEIAGQRVVLLHGDILCTRDQAYQRFRALTRPKVVKAILRRLPLKKRQQIAADLRSKSMSANSNKAENIMDVTPEEVEKLLEENAVSLMIHGHTHRPDRHQHQHGERIVLGDWNKTGWMLRVSADDIELIEFPLSSEPAQNPSSQPS